MPVLGGTAITSMSRLYILVVLSVRGLLNVVRFWIQRCIVIDELSDISEKLILTSLGLLLWA